MSHLAPDTVHDGHVENVLKTIHRMTGTRPTTCPWQAFEDPTVLDVLDLHRSVRGDMSATPALLLPSDPPAHLWEGVLLYEHCRNKMADEQRRKASSG